MKKICSIIVLILCAATLFAGLVPRLWPPLLKKAAKKGGAVPSWTPPKEASLQYWYRGGEDGGNLVDTQGNEDLTATGTPIFTNGWWELEGDGDYFSWGGQRAFTNVWTLCAWVNMDSRGYGDYQNFLGSQYAGKQVFGIRYATLCQMYTGTGPYKVTGGNGDPAGEWVGDWYHFLVTCDNTNYTMYVDGVEVSSYSPSAHLMSGQIFYFQWQGRGNTANWDYDGKMDELMMWDTFLTPAEITNVYQNTTYGE